MFLSHFCIYFYQITMWVFFWRNHFSVFLNHLCSIRNMATILLLPNWNRSCDKHQASKQIDFHFVRKRRIVLRSNVVTSHFVLCETKPTNFCYVVYKNLSMLCLIIFPFCVWQFVHVVYNIFWLLFLSILCMTLSMTSNF